MLKDEWVVLGVVSERREHRTTLSSVKLASAHHETLPSSSQNHLSHWEQSLTLERKRADSTSSLKPWSWMMSPEERERAGRGDERN